MEQKIFIEELKKLKDQYTSTRSVKKRAAIDAQITALVNKDRKEFSLAMIELMKETRTRVEATLEQARVRELSRAVSMAYIARTYFQKSRGWLYQRINGSIVNGKPARFNDEERKTLEHAFHDIGGMLTSIRIS
jgi:DNA-binding protein